jgi:formylglycine-generating enzyme required for sulfatase activity
LPVDSFRVDTKEDLETLFRDLYAKANDAASRSAAEFALKKWEAELAEIKTAKTAPADSNWFNNEIGMTMIRIPSGEFKMGSDVPGHPRNEQPLPELVRVEAFYLCDREVTQAQYREYLVWKSKRSGETVPPTNSAYHPGHPFHEAGYFNAVAFCDYLNARMGLDDSNSTGDSRYRLPTEAEWEYACRANTHTDFSCGDQTYLEDYAVLQRSKPALCASKLPNAWGFFDMHGNVHEWCSSRYRDTYQSSELQPERVHRGGWWILELHDARSAKRESSSSENDYEDGFGFRVALGCK